MNVIVRESLTSLMTLIAMSDHHHPRDMPVASEDSRFGACGPLAYIVSPKSHGLLHPCQSIHWQACQPLRHQASIAWVYSVYRDLAEAVIWQDMFSHLSCR